MYILIYWWNRLIFMTPDSLLIIYKMRLKWYLNIFMVFEIKQVYWFLAQLAQKGYMRYYHDCVCHLLSICFHLFSKLSNQMETRKNCLRYLKLMSPLNATICTTTYLERQKMLWPGHENTIWKTIIPWGQRSRSHEGLYGAWPTAL